MEANLGLVLSIGIFVGTLMGLTGAGGGILSVPLLVFFFHLPITTASPIALCAITLSASIGALIGLQQKVLRYKAAMFMSVFGLIMSPLGMWVAQIVPNEPLLILFSIVLIYVAVRLLIQAHQSTHGKQINSTSNPPCKFDYEIGRLTWTIPCARSLMMTGVMAGFLSGLLGVGGGFVIVPSLKKYTDLSMKSIVATSLGVLAIVSLGGAVFSLASGNLNVNLALPFALGTAGGLLLGKLLERKLSGLRVQQIFAVFTLLVAVNLIYKALHHYSIV
jgi:uncharacterized protein